MYIGETRPKLWCLDIMYSVTYAKTKHRIIWACFEATRPGNLTLTESTICLPKCARVECETMWVQQLKFCRNWVMQQDNDRNHSRKFTTEWLKEKNQGFSMTQSKSRLQSHWNDVVGGRCAKNECNTQWNKATLPRRVGQNSSTMMMRDWESHSEKNYFKALLLKVALRAFGSRGGLIHEIAWSLFKKFLK